MNKYLSLALLGALMQFAQGTADEAVQNTDGKIYVKPRAVRFMKKGIVVHTKDGAFITPSVSRDENGLFVQEKELVQAPAIASKLKRKCGGCQKGKGKGIHHARKWHMRKNGQGRKSAGRPHWNKDVPAVAAPAEAEVEAGAQ